MAGIGFELKRLFHEKSAFGYFKACVYTAIVTIGPFVLMTGMVLGIQQLFNVFQVSYIESQIYVASVIYAFVFSHIVTSGFAMLITRYISDLLYCENYKEIVPSLYGMAALAVVIGAIPAGIFFWNKPLEFSLKATTYIFYLEMIVIWIQCVYLTALKDYKKIIISYAAGVFLAIFLVFSVLQYQFLPILTGTMLAMDIGAAVINILLLVHIKQFFPQENYMNFAFLIYFKTHASLFFNNLFYTIGLYIPNLIFWHSTLGVGIADTYIYAPKYDIATFYGFLSILPIMVMFIVSTEVHFYQKYAVYFMYVTEKGNFKDIEDARRDLFHVMWAELRNIIEFQLVFTLIFLAFGNYFLPQVGVDYSSVNMYNLIVLGAYATGIMQIVTILLLYFEDRKGAYRISVVYCCLNLIFNVVSLQLGEDFYGFGFFLASFISLIAALVRLHYLSKRIDYFVFCSRPIFSQEGTGFFYWLMKKLGTKHTVELEKLQ